MPMEKPKRPRPEQEQDASGAEPPTGESEGAGSKRRRNNTASKFTTSYPLEPPSTLLKTWLEKDKTLTGYEGIVEKFQEIHRKFRDPESELYAWMENETAEIKKKGISGADLQELQSSVYHKHYRWATKIDGSLRKCADHCKGLEKEDPERVQKVADGFEGLRTLFRQNIKVVKTLYNLDKYKEAVLEIGDLEHKPDEFSQAWELYRKEMEKYKKTMNTSLNDENTISEEKEKIKEHLKYYSEMCKKIAGQPKEALSIITPPPLPSKTVLDFKESKLHSNSTLEDYTSFATEIKGIYDLYLGRKNEDPGSALYEWSEKELAAQIKKHPETPQLSLRQLIGNEIRDWRRYMDTTLLRCKEEVKEMGVRDPKLPVESVNAAVEQFEELRHLFFELQPFDLRKTLDLLDKYYKQNKPHDRTDFRTTFQSREYMLDALLKAPDSNITESDKALILKFKQHYSEIKSKYKQRPWQKPGWRKGKQQKTNEEGKQGVEEDEEINREESIDWNEDEDVEDGFDFSAHFDDALPDSTFW